MKMAITKPTLIIFSGVVVLSVFVSNICNIISVATDISTVDAELSNKNENYPVYRTQSDIGDSPDRLMWFIQISDIHISIFHDPTRISQFKEFCDLTIAAIQPSVVLATGDLTDAKTDDNMGSRQFVDEWITYKTILEETKVESKTVWLDIRGNHDNFNVPGPWSKLNYYRNYSVQGGANPKSYSFFLKKGSETYSFVGVDACLEPGPRRPFNFVGILTVSEMEHLKKLINESSQISNYTVWFGHYPTSCILAPGSGIRGLIGRNPESLAYLCGHFHMLGGTVPNMYTIQQAGFLELELGDWKDNRIYRIAAIDHGMFSFIDVNFQEWPVGFITNPKHSMFVMNSRESVRSISRSTYIRALAFSISPIEKVKVRINEEDWIDCEAVEFPLYVASWDPSKYATGLHIIYLFVKDSFGREKVFSQTFSLDGSRTSFRLLPRIALMSNVSRVFQCMFGVMLFACVVPLCVLRYMHKLTKAKRISKPNSSFRIINSWVRKLWVLSSVDRLFFPLVTYPLYLTIGPWSVGEIIEGYVGIIFAWGTIINGSYLPGSFTYAYGFLQMCTFQFPLTLCLANCVEQRLNGTSLKSSRTGIICQHIAFSSIIALQMMFAYFFWLAYGTMAFFLGPLRTWSVLLGLILWHLANRLPDKCLREAASVWSSRNPELATYEQELATTPALN